MLILNTKFVKLIYSEQGTLWVFCSLKLGSVCILCIKPVLAPSLLQGVVCLSPVPSAHCSLDGVTPPLHLSLLPLLKFSLFGATTGWSTYV